MRDVAILLILIALFGFVLAGFGSGSSTTRGSTTVHIAPQTVTSSSQRASKPCARIKGASAQGKGCRYLPVNP